MNIEEYKTKLEELSKEPRFNLMRDDEIEKILSNGIRTNRFTKKDIDYLLEGDYCDCPEEESRILIFLKNFKNK